MTVTGGKLTTYRKMAQDTVDAVVGRLGESPSRRRCVTKSLPLMGATHQDPRSRDAGPTPLPACSAATAPSRPTSCAVADGRPELLEPVIAGLPYTGAELVYAAREEMAQTLDDVLSRRTRAMIQRAQPTMAAAASRGHLIAPDMGWDEQEAAEQATRFIESCQKELLTAGLDLRDRTDSRHADRRRPARRVPDRLGGAAVEVPPGAARPDRGQRGRGPHRRRHRAEAGRDWWPLAIGWAAEGAVPSGPASWSARRRPNRWPPCWPPATRPRCRSPPPRAAAVSAEDRSRCTAASPST